MTNRFGAVVVAGLMALVAPAVAETPAATTQKVVKQRTKAAAAVARRHPHPHRYVDRAYHPTYYDRPYVYRPYPYSSPAPFTLGFGFGPLWW